MAIEESVRKVWNIRETDPVIAQSLESIGLPFLFFILFDFANNTSALREIESGIFGGTFLRCLCTIVFSRQLQRAADLLDKSGEFTW